MLTLEMLDRRIAITRDLRSIVRTMKTLSAVSIRQYETAAAALREYNRTIDLGLQVVLRRRAFAPAPAPAPARPAGQGVAVVFGSDRGLCGRFNEEVADFAVRTLDHLGIARGARMILAVGLRAAARLEANGQTVDRVDTLAGSAAGLSETAEDVLLTLDRWRAAPGVDRVLLFHNRRASRSSAVPRQVQLLPLDPAYLGALARRPWPSRRLPDFTMDRERLFSSLVRQHLYMTVYRAAADSLASEHATRLASMQAAERNIDERLEEMSAEFRHRRQEAITAELLDVVAGFETQRRAAKPSDRAL